MEGLIIIYIRDDIPNRLLGKYVLLCDTEGLFIELNFRKFR